MMEMALPSGLPSISKARLPASYAGAKTALAECSRIDECKDWADKAEALASYAKQAQDDELRKMADRIQARAIRRCGELLRAIKPAKNQHDARGAGNGADTSRKAAAHQAGLSKRQKDTAVRVARVPTEEFETAVESDRPPTVTELAERGRRRTLLDLKGREPAEFAASTEAQGTLRRFVELAERIEPAVVARGAFPKERRVMRHQTRRVHMWLRDLMRELKKLKGKP